MNMESKDNHHIEVLKIYEDFLNATSNNIQQRYSVLICGTRFPFNRNIYMYFINSK